MTYHAVTRIKREETEFSYINTTHKVRDTENGRSDRRQEGVKNDKHVQ